MTLLIRKYRKVLWFVLFFLLVPSAKAQKFDWVKKIEGDSGLFLGLGAIVTHDTLVMSGCSLNGMGAIYFEGNQVLSIPSRNRGTFLIAYSLSSKKVVSKAFFEGLVTNGYENRGFTFLNGIAYLHGFMDPFTIFNQDTLFTGWKYSYDDIAIIGFDISKENVLCKTKLSAGGWGIRTSLLHNSNEINVIVNKMFSGDSLYVGDSTFAQKAAICQLDFDENLNLKNVTDIVYRVGNGYVIQNSVFSVENETQITGVFSDSLISGNDTLIVRGLGSFLTISDSSRKVTSMKLIDNYNNQIIAIKHRSKVYSSFYSGIDSFSIYGSIKQKKDYHTSAFSGLFSIDNAQLSWFIPARDISYPSYGALVPKQIAKDINQNLIVVGGMFQDLTINNYPSYYKGVNAIIKLDTFGNIIWIFRAGSKTNQQPIERVFIDSNAFYVLGNLGKDNVFGKDTINSSYPAALFITKISDKGIYLTPPSVHSYCAGRDSITLKFHTSGSFDLTSVYALQVSNSQGQFDSLTTNLGSVTGPLTGDSGFITAALPIMHYGTGYKFRILADTPAIVSYYVPDTFTLVPIASIKSVFPDSICVGLADTLIDATKYLDSVQVSLYSKHGNYSYTGYPGSTFSLPISISSPGIDTFTWVTQNRLGCYDTTYKIITCLEPLKPANALKNIPYCPGSIVTLTSDTGTTSFGGFHMQWFYLQNNATTLLDSQATINYQPVAIDTLLIQLADQCGNQRTDTLIASPFISPFFTSSDSLLACFGSHLLLDINWNNPSKLQTQVGYIASGDTVYSTILDTTIPGDISLRLFCFDYCFGMQFHDLFIQSTPALQVNAHVLGQVCEGSSVVDTLQISGGSGNITVHGTSLLTGQTFNSAPFNYTTTIVGFDTINWVVSDTCQTVRVSQPIWIISKPFIEFLGDTQLCQGDSLHLEARISVGSTYSNPAWQFNSQSFSGRYIECLPVATGYAYFSATDALCGLIVDSVLISVHPLPVASFHLGKSSFCADEPLVLNDLTQVTESYSVHISIEDATQTILDTSLASAGFPYTRFFQPGTYTLHFQSITVNGCASSILDSTFTVLPLPTIDLPADTVVSYADPLFTIPYSLQNGWLQSLQTDGLLLKDSSQTHWTFSVPDTGFYTLHATAENTRGCTSSDSVRIHVTDINRLYVPSAFSPNAEGPEANNTFHVTGRGITIMYLLVFDRWGQQVFRSVGDPSKSWDGTLNGKPMPAGNYSYFVQALFENGTEQKITGTVLLIR